MRELRDHPLCEIAGVAVLQRKDYSSGILEDVSTGVREEVELKGSNVLKYKLADGTDLVVRPSGTEPKVKVYILSQGESHAPAGADTRPRGPPPTPPRPPHRVRALRFISHRLLPQYNRATVPGPVWAPMMGPI